jgi:peroxiredoxin Q/BCP
MLKPGDVAPDFELPIDDGSLLRLSDLRGTKVVLFFYPRADTPGCTIQACEMRDHQDDFDAAEVVVLGISPDPVGDIAAFREKFGLTFRLLADEDHAVAEKYGVWKEKSLYGNRYWGVERTTFVIDESGRVTQVLEKVKPEAHADQLLSSLTEGSARH